MKAKPSQSNIIISNDIPLWQPVLFSALAGGLGWGIRGQYGHETGAMIAGLLVCLTLVFFLFPKGSLRNSTRAIAWGTVAIGFGGSMTYGQTIGLSCDKELIGNWAAWRWGMLGLSIKGGLWIGFAGIFLGMGLGGIIYRSRELLLLMLALLAAYFAGIYMLNTPYDPAHKILPAIYFSDHWYWEPNAELKPRREVWGGLLFAFMTIILYTGWKRKDRLAPRMALWGFLGGALGFPLGQCLQSFHAWNPEIFKTGLWLHLDPFMNWWNMMETTFGIIMGGVLGLGLWLNRNLIQNTPEHEETFISSPIGWILLVVHLTLLTVALFTKIPLVNALYNTGLIMGIIPIVVCACVRWWPFFIMFPITLLPIAGKTFNQLALQEHAINPVFGGIIYLIIPILLAIMMVYWLGKIQSQLGDKCIRYALLFNTWIYFLLNYGFFHYPWPWAQWTSRTPNGIIFTLCTLGLTAAALVIGREKCQQAETTVASK